MYACWFSVPQMRQFCLFTYPPRSKWTSSKISIFCNSIAGPLPSVVQAYTQPYLFGGRIKLFNCLSNQCYHSLVEKITLDGGPYSLTSLGKLSVKSKAVNCHVYIMVLKFSVCLSVCVPQPSIKPPVNISLLLLVCTFLSCNCTRI